MRDYLGESFRKSRKDLGGSEPILGSDFKRRPRGILRSPGGSWPVPRAMFGRLPREAVQSPCGISVNSAVLPREAVQSPCGISVNSAVLPEVVQGFSIYWSIPRGARIVGAGQHKVRPFLLRGPGREFPGNFPGIPREFPDIVCVSSSRVSCSADGRSEPPLLPRFELGQSSCCISLS